MEHNTNFFLCGIYILYCILVLHLSGSIVSIIAMLSGLLVSAIIYWLAQSGPYGFSNSRLILTGIGAQAFLNALVSWLLLKAAQYDVPNALRWLSGSLNNVNLSEIPRLLFVTATVSLFLSVCAYFLFYRRITFYQVTRTFS